MTYFKRYFVVPITSLLTVCLVGYISWTYFMDFLPLYAKYSSQPGAIILGLLFGIFPIMIYWVLFKIVISDPGFVTEKIVNHIYQ